MNRMDNNKFLKCNSILTFLLPGPVSETEVADGRVGKNTKKEGLDMIKWVSVLEFPFSQRLEDYNPRQTLNTAKYD